MTDASPVQRRAYGAVARTLHWGTLAALVAQFTIGYVMHGDDDSGHGRGRGQGEGSGHGRGRGGDDDTALGGGWSLLHTHVTLGLFILLLAVVRVAWRRASGLPQWAETLSPGERRLATVTERTLLTTLFVIPLTGIALVLGDDDLLPLHVAAHVTFFAALATHVGLVLKHQLVDRDRLLARML
jgi:cytochrome b561